MGKIGKERGEQMKNLIRFITVYILVLMIFLNCQIQAEASSLIANPNISWSPDGQAFTTDAGEKNYITYLPGTKIQTGIKSSLRGLETGEHYYKKDRKGDIPIGKWESAYSPGRCIHNSYLPEDNPYYHGINYGKQKCLGKYKTGWIGYCADCSEAINILFYMDKETAESLKTLQTGLTYFYLCPLCNNLEQGVKIIHDCNSISWNQYFVEYDKNRGIGYMGKSTYMYNNATIYEGNEITPETCLKKCTYYREGFEFIGWNTERDGSGKAFEDGQVIYNLLSEDEARIILYAQWKKSESTLYIDPAGGSFAGTPGITTSTQGYGKTLDVSASKVTPPEGNLVQFVTNGGTPVPDMRTIKHFLYWQQSNPFHGLLEGDTYTYKGANETEDTLTAAYQAEPIILPETRKEGISFGGWFKDPECTLPAGAPGDRILITEDTVFYAKWVELQLVSTDNYTAFGGSGAVDLSWRQEDSLQKTYRLYQSRDQVSWSPLSQKDTGTEPLMVSETFSSSGKEETYTVPCSGFYTLTLYGAQGESYGSRQGGKGGQITAGVWLSKGEVLTYAVGTRQGFPGGGTGSPYGNGGGMTRVSSSLKGTLLIAGGGGGASSEFEGGMGGSTQSVLAVSQGGSGGTGGGGGYRGGTGGEVLRHTHRGTGTAGGGCYTVPVRCGGSMTGHTQNGEIGGWYCGRCAANGNRDCTGSSAVCGQCGHGGPGHCSHAWYYPGKTTYTCSKCGYGYGTANPGTCSRTTGYRLGCAYSNRPDGYIISARQAFGGSNYADSAFCVLKEDKAGVRTGEGCLQISLQEADYLDAQQLSGVRAKDEAAPDAVEVSTVKKTPAGSTEIRLVWDTPADHGTVYYHRAESYSAAAGTKLCDSNITVDTLTSGIGGYYYLVDGEAATAVDRQNGIFISANALTVTPEGAEQYLHLTAADVAGNLSSAVHIKIGSGDSEVAWPLYTEQMTITGSAGNVYAAAGEKTWYVRADGETPFSLAFRAYMEHAALESYQIDHMLFDITQESSGVCQNYDIHMPAVGITEGEITAGPGELTRTMTGSPLLSDAAYTRMVRSNYCKDMDILQHFTLPAEFDAQTLTVAPGAGAEQGQETVYSSRPEDVLHGIRLIGDGTAPAVEGTALLERLQEIDREAGRVLLDLTCSDAGSGVREFYLEVTNLDNFITKTFQPEADGHLRVDITNPEEFVFNGDFTITVHAIDNVGNDAELRYSTCEFSLNAGITRMLEPHEPIFRRGETGILHILATGYVDRIEVEICRPLFPEGKIFTYSNPDYLQQEDVEFFIPLDAQEKEYTVVVRAYKNGQCLEAYPKAAVMKLEGTVLDDFRRKILWN